MPNLLVYAETVAGAPSANSLELLAGARALAGVGGGVSVLAVEDDQPLRLDGLTIADKVLVYRKGQGQAYDGDRHIAALSRAIAILSPDLVLLPNSYIGLDLAAPVAAAADLPLVGYAIGLEWQEGKLAVRSQLYGGKAEAVVEVVLPALVTVNPGVFKPQDGVGAADIVELTDPDAKTSRIRVERIDVASDGDVDITLSERLVCVGRGVGDEDAIEQFRELARLLGGELAASRPVVDLGWVAKSRQVGKSGKTVKPKLYLAFGVSGAPEHLEGMRDAELIVAVNTDPSAPIFDAAHFGIISDAAELAEILTQKLGEAGF